MSMIRRYRLDLLLAPVAFFALIGMGLSCTLVGLQVVNPSRQILSLAHWHDYRLFFGMGAHLPEFTVLGVIAASCMLTCFLLWSARCMGVVTIWRRAGFERVSLGRLLLWGLQLLFLYGVAGAAAYALLWIDVCSGTAFDPAHAVLVGQVVLGVPELVLVAYVLAAFCRASSARQDLHTLLETWKGGRWSAGLIAAAALLAGGVVFALLALNPLQLQAVARPDVYPVPSFLWTHFGPAGIFICVTITMAFLGLGAGLALYGLAPDEPTDPMPQARLRIAALVAGVAVLVALALHGLWLVPRYQIGQDLRRLLALRQATVEARTVVWLDKARAPVQEPALETWSTAENAARVGDWMERAPSPSAQTRPGAAILGNRAIWDWDPDSALHWLDVQRRRQPHDSNLNAAMVEFLRATSPTPARSALAEAFTDPTRFAWPGAVSHLKVAVLLHRCGQETRARQWATSGEELLQVLDDPAAVGLRRMLQEPAPDGEIRGRLLLGGAPLSGAKVAFFHSFDQGLQGPENLLHLARRTIEEEPALMSTERDWHPSSRAYMNFRSLLRFYTVVTTDATGSFQAGPLDPGRYLMSVRLPIAMTGSPRVDPGVGLPRLVPGRMRVDLGDVRIRP